MFLARRNLFQDKTRLALSIGGVALAVMLILILKGFLSGMNHQIASYIDHSPGSLLVAQKGIRNLLGATSILPPKVSDQIENASGVEKVIPILSQFVILDLHGKKQPAYMIGYELEQGGGPWKITDGREPSTNTEMTMDRVIARRHNLNIGDTFEVLDKNFTIVGLSDGTTSWMASFFFILKPGAEALLRAPGATSYLLIETKTGVNLKDIQSRLNELPGINALTKDEVSANDIKLFAKVFSAPLKLMVGIAFLVGTMVVGLVIYTATVERQREYGVIKAIGANNGVLYRVVTAQALVAATAGAIAGVLLAYLTAQAIIAVRAQFLIVIEPRDVLLAFLAGLGMALLAALFPARVISGLAPAEVFRK
ncbi:MAG TPA: FtsX-like permease family protein [Anaerolineales bacterium]|nr:FtsX-like permease family protein [Anaerolineales bacterium]